MDLIRTIVALGRGIREKERIKVRQPLSKLVVPVISDKVNGGSQTQVQQPVKNPPKRDIGRRNTDGKKRGSGEQPQPELPESVMQEVRNDKPS